MSTGSDTPVRILLLSDQPILADVVTLTLNHGQFLARPAQDRPQALKLLKEWHPQVVIVDMDAAEGSVSDIVSSINAQNRAPAIGVLALTRRGDLKTKLAAFDQGCDDFMTVPLEPTELLARVLVMVRRTSKVTVPLRPVIKIGELEVDILSRTARVGGSEIHLTSLEQGLLYLLAANPGRVLTREEILDALWGSDFVVESNVVDRHVRSLRAKLQNGWRHPRFIATAPGRGYRFVALAAPSSEGPTAPAS